MDKENIILKTVHVYRYDPAEGGDGHFDTFKVGIHDEYRTTLLDVLLKIQQQMDPSLAFRYACRVSMCGSCAMVANGLELLACKTTVASLNSKDITIRPLNHFPIIKDLVVDMGPFFLKYQEAMTFFEPAQEREEPAIVLPTSKERVAIGRETTECIACGCCASSCTMMNYHQGYLGPAVLNRSFSLLLDTRDGLYGPRMDHVLESCYNCRTELNCTEVCPKDISPTRAIKYIQRLALKEPFKNRSQEEIPDHSQVQIKEPPHQSGERSLRNPSRRRFMRTVTHGVGAVTALFVGGILASAAVGPSLRRDHLQWVRIGRMEDFEPGQVKNVNITFTRQNGFYETRNESVILVWRKPDSDLVVYSSKCPHLSCGIRWNEEQQRFLCACHGGAFNIQGEVVAGPPPRPMYRYDFKAEDGYLFAEV